MSKSWVALIVAGLAILVFWTGVQFYTAITGANNKRVYQIDQIQDNFGNNTLNFLSSNKDNVLKNEEDI